MKTSRWRDWFLNHFFKFVFAFICLSASLSFAGPARTTYQAKIVKPDGYPLEAANVNFRFTILDPSGTCILYTETYSSVDMSSSSGLISFALGSGVKTYPVSATTFEDVFSNITPTLSCDAGGPPSYSPAANDVRKIVMQFNDGPGWQTLPAMSINAVPYAMYANNAEKLGGVSATSYVQYSTIPTCTASDTLTYNGTNFSCIAGGGGGSVTSSTVITALGYTPADGVSVTALTSDMSTVSSTVTSVSATVNSLQNSVAASFAAITSSQWSDVASGISYSSGNVGIGTSTPVMALDVSGSVQFAGDILYNNNPSSVFSIKPATARAIGATNPIALYSNINAINDTNGGSYIEVYPDGGAGVNNGGRVNITAYGQGTGANSNAIRFFNRSGVGSVSERMRIHSTGNVGIGTTTPVTKLSVSGGVQISMESATCAVSYAGTLRYNAGAVEFCNGTTWAAFGVSGTGVQSFNGSTSGTQTFANSLTGTTPAFATANGVHTLNIPYASEAATTAGLISNAEYVNFSNKLSIANNLSDLASATVARINLGLGSVATLNSIDLSTSQATGIIADARLADQAGVVSGTQYTKLTVDSKGRVVSGAQLDSSDVIAALGYTPGSAASGITSFNGSSSQTQTLANSLTGTTPAFVTNNGVHTLNIPYASEATTTAGLISNSEYSTFMNKITSSVASIAEVLGYTPVASGSLVSSQWTTSGAAVYYNAGNVGVGTTNPTGSLTVVGNSSAVLTSPLVVQNTAAYAAPFNQYSQIWLKDTGSVLASLRQDGSFTVFGSASNIIANNLSANSNGSATQAAFKRSNDIGTGMFFPNTGSLALTTSGTERFRIDGSGNVGIGTSAPARLLDVAGSINISGTNGDNNIYFPASVSTSYPGIVWNNDNTGAGSLIAHSYLGNTSDFGQSWLFNAYQTGNAAATNLKRLRSNYTPARLSISAHEGGFIYTTASSGSSGTDITDWQTRFKISNTGKVGIGTSSPVALLSVSGGVQISMESAACAVSYAGTLRYNAGNVEFCNGTTWAAFGVSGAGVQSFNGSTSGTQSFANSLSGTTPVFVTANGVHTLNIPYASEAATTAGLISNAEYVNFSNKLNATSAAIAATLGYTPADDAVVGASITALTNSTAASFSAITSSQWATSGSAIYYNTGNVGIGTSSPGTLLQIGENSINSSAFRFAPASDQSAMRFTTSSAANWIQSGVDFNNGSGKDLRFSSIGGVTTWMTLQASTGNVGIGTATPLTNLHVRNNFGSGVEGSLLTLDSAATSSGNGSTIDFINSLTSGAGYFASIAGIDSGSYKGRIEFRTSNATSTTTTRLTSADTKMVLTASGNVGIGTTTPASPLEVNGDITATGGPGALNLKADVNDHTYIQFFARTATPSTRSGFFGYPSSGTIHMNLFNEISSGSLVFGTSGAERLRIDASGNIGVGYSAPTAKLQLAAGTSSLAPLKFTSGTLLSSPQIGTMEYDGFNFYLTDGGGTRRTIATGSGSGAIDNASVISSSGNMSLVPVGSVIVSSTTASTDSQTGALVVNGGMGVAGNIYSSGTIITSSNIQGSSITATSGMISPYIAGSIVSGGSLTLDSTTHSSKGNIIVAPNGGNVGIGTSTPSALLEVSGTSSLLASFGSGPSSQTNYIEMNSRAYFGYNGVTNNAVVQGIASKGIEFNVNNMTFGSGTAMVINSSGNVGIGTTNPGSTAVKSFNKVVDLVSTTDNAIQGYSIRNPEGTNNRRVGFFLDDSTGTYGLDSTATTGLAEFVLQVAGAEKVRLTNSGNIGIGVSAPTLPLHVYSAANHVANFDSGYNTAGSGAGIFIRNTASGGVSAGNKRMIYFSANDTTNTMYNTAYIQARAETAAGVGDIPTALDFGTGSSTASTRMTINASGNVGIGTTAPTARLSVSKTVVGADNEIVTLQNAVPWSSTSGYMQQLIWRDHSNIAGAIGLKYNSSGATVDFTINSLYNGGAYQPSSNIPFIVRGNGNVGIGTSSPVERLDFGTCGGATPCNFKFGNWSYLGTGAAGYPYLSFGTVWDGAQWNTTHTTVSGMMIRTNATGMLFESAPANTAGASLTYRLFISNSTGNVGVGTVVPVTKLEVAGGVKISMESATCAVSYAGTLRYNAGNVEFCNGSTWAAFGVAGSGVTSFNGSTSGTQSLAFGIAGTSPGFSTANGVHTLNIPYASEATTTAGLISNSEYTSFSNKIASSAASIAEVLGYVPAASGAVSSQWTTSGTAIFYNTGNVGIGTSAPTTTLHLVTSQPTGFILERSSSAANSNIQFKSQSGSMYAGLSDSNNFGIGSTNSLSSATLTVTTTGNVGIGTISPGSKLHVVGDEIRISGSSAPSGGGVDRLAFGSVDGSYKWIQSYGTQPLALNPISNNVGIGTTTPTAKLQISGNGAGADGLLHLSSTSGNADGALVRLGPYAYLNTSANGSSYWNWGSRYDGATDTWVRTYTSLDSYLPYIRSHVDTITIGGAVSNLTTDSNPTMQDRVTFNLATGNIGIGITAPTAKLHIVSGTSSLAPLKFTSGTLLSSAQPGAMEYDGFNFFITDGASVRRTIATQSSAGVYDSVSAINNSSGNISLTPQSAGSVIVSSTAASTNSSTGALIVNGGMGVVGNIYSSGTIITSSNMQGASLTATSGMITPYIFGSTVSGGSLTLDSTTHGNKGSITIGSSATAVGVGGAPSTTAKLKVSGTIAGNTNVIASGGSVNLALSNIHILQSVGSASIALSNFENGGVYTIIVSDTTARTYTFSGCTNSYFNPTNGSTTDAARTIYGITAINTGGSNYDCYITWSSGFQ